MTEGEAALREDETEDKGRETGLLMRAYRAFELLFSVHAKIAQREVSQDLRRIVAGLILALASLTLVSFALILGHAAAVLAVEQRFQWGMTRSIGAVAAADVVVAFILFLIARARLSSPVLSETRATLKKAASVLRG